MSLPQHDTRDHARSNVQIRRIRNAGSSCPVCGNRALPVFIFVWVSSPRKERPRALSCFIRSCFPCEIHRTRAASSTHKRRVSSPCMRNSTWGLVFVGSMRPALVESAVYMEEGGTRRDGALSPSCSYQVRPFGMTELRLPGDETGPTPSARCV